MMTREQLIWAISEMENGVDRKNIADHDQAQRAAIEQQKLQIESDQHAYNLLNERCEQQAKEIAELKENFQREIDKRDHHIVMFGQQNTTLREALQLLYDCQNGCPLPKYETDWNRAMELAQHALKEVS